MCCRWRHLAFTIHHITHCVNFTSHLSLSLDRDPDTSHLIYSEHFSTHLHRMTGFILVNLWAWKFLFGHDLPCFSFHLLTCVSDVCRYIYNQSVWHKHKHTITQYLHFNSPWYYHHHHAQLSWKPYITHHNTIIWHIAMMSGVVTH